MVKQSGKGAGAGATPFRSTKKLRRINELRSQLEAEKRTALKLQCELASCQAKLARYEAEEAQQPAMDGANEGY